VATALKRGEPPFTTDLDSVCADVANWTRVSHARRRRRILGAVFSGDDDFWGFEDDDERGFDTERPLKVTPDAALRLRGGGFEVRSPTLALLALCDVYAPSLAARLDVDRALSRRRTTASSRRRSAPKTSSSAP